MTILADSLYIRSFAKIKNEHMDLHNPDQYTFEIYSKFFGLSWNVPDIGVGYGHLVPTFRLQNRVSSHRQQCIQIRHPPHKCPRPVNRLGSSVSLLRTTGFDPEVHLSLDVV